MLRGGSIVGATGIGPALRNARLLRGKSIEEASRETRIKADYLHALERERFEALLGDVYVRGCLRSYSSYLGIDADHVLTIYSGRFGAPSPTVTDGPLPAGDGDRAHGLPELVRHHPSWSVLAVVAVLVLAVFAGMGLLSRSRSAPPPAPIGHSPAAGGTGTFKVTLVVHARAAVDVIVRADGALQAGRFSLRPDETRTFQAETSIVLQLSKGGAAELTVNGHRLGHPGKAASPYSATYGPNSPGGSPSPNGP
jgi:cytoskeleton protein RodZ